MKLSHWSYGFATFFRSDGLYYFQFNNRQGVPILFSSGYLSEEDRDKSIQTIIHHADEEHIYELKESEDGKHFFSLKASNDQMIARSRLFGHKNEMEAMRNILKSISEDTPVFELDELPVDEEIIKKHPATSTAINQHNEETSSLPRYKFSIIYYPDSDIWIVKHDFSEHTRRLTACDGKEIEQFLKSYVPEAKKRTAMPVPSTDPTASPTSTSQSQNISTNPSEPQQTSTNPPKEQAKKDTLMGEYQEISEDLEINILDFNREVSGKFVEVGKLSHVELTLHTEIPNKMQICDCKVIAKSLEDHSTLILVKYTQRKLDDSALVFPIFQANNLTPGLYRITATIHQSQRKESKDYVGSLLIMLK